MSHYRVFVSRLLHTSTEGKEPRKGRTGFGKTGLFMYSRRKKTHVLYSIASNRCATQVVGMEDTNTAIQGDRAGGVGWGVGFRCTEGGLAR